MTSTNNIIELSLDLTVLIAPLKLSLPLELQNIESFIWIDLIDLIRIISPTAKSIGMKPKFIKEDKCYISVEEFNVPVNGKSNKCNVTISLRVE